MILDPTSSGSFPAQPPKVLAVLVQGEQGAIDLDAVQDAVSGQLAKFKHPKRYVLVSGLPRNTMGKVQKNVLRDTYATEFQL